MFCLSLLVVTRPFRVQLGPFKDLFGVHDASSTKLPAALAACAAVVARCQLISWLPALQRGLTGGGGLWV